MRNVLLLSLALASPVGAAALSDTGGPLSADQAAYDVLAIVAHRQGLAQRIAPGWNQVLCDIVFGTFTV